MTAADLPKSYQELTENYRSTARTPIFETTDTVHERWISTTPEARRKHPEVYVKRPRESGWKRWRECAPYRQKLADYLVPFAEFEHEGKPYHVMKKIPTISTISAISGEKEMNITQFFVEALQFGLGFLCECMKIGAVYLDIKPDNMVCSENDGFRMIDLDAMYILQNVTVEDEQSVEGTIVGLTGDNFKYATLFDHSIFHMLFTFTIEYGVTRADMFRGVNCAEGILKSLGTAPMGRDGSPFGRYILCKDAVTYDDTHPFYKALGNLRQTDFTELVAKIYKANMAQARAATDAIRETGTVPEASQVRDVCALAIDAE